jgi:hypothetical protein
MSRAIHDATACGEALSRLPELDLSELRQHWRALYKADPSRMSGIHREMRRPIELDVMPHGPKIPPDRERLSCLDFQGSNCHRAPPSVLACNAAPDRQMKSNRLAEVKNRLNSRTQSAIPLGGVVDSQGQRAAHPDIVEQLPLVVRGDQASAVPITLLNGQLATESGRGVLVQARQHKSRKIG